MKNLLAEAAKSALAEQASCPHSLYVACLDHGRVRDGGTGLGLGGLRQ